MTNISLHIQQLLRHHDCVILPSIGAFIASYKSANINVEWGIITPPKREIYFNASIINNDGLLANSIARKNRISFEAANIILMQEIEQIRTQLQRNKEFAIGRLGILHLGDEENIDFKAFKTDNQLNANYGLHQFKMKTLKELQQVDFNTIQPTQDLKRSDKNYYIPINKQFAKYAAMFIVVFFAAISLSVPQGQYIQDNQELASLIPIKKTHKETSTIDSTTLSNTVADQTIPTVPHSTQQEYESIDNTQCYAVVATMKTIAEAEKYIRLKKTDRQLQIVTIGKMSRVYTHCGSRQEMAKIISNSQFQQEFPGAWIWQPKN